jgi:dihydrofolate synthase/folylpolyglutamate synthase
MESDAILGRQPNGEVIAYFDEVAREKGCRAVSMDTMLTTKEQQDISTIAEKEGLAYYLQENLLLSLSALKFLGFSADVKTLSRTPLFGRLTKLRDNIVLDVGHNLLAAQAIVKTLFGEKYTLIYNSYRDKDYVNIIKTLKPIIEAVELISVDDVRVEQESALEAVIKAEDIAVSKFATIEQNKSYLVFGSFSVAETFLKQLED